MPVQELKGVTVAYRVDAEVVIDGNRLTSRKPDDLPAFHSLASDVRSPRERRSHPRCLAIQRHWAARSGGRN
jgi:hypothetical protein